MSHEDTLPRAIREEFSSRNSQRVFHHGDRSSPVHDDATNSVADLNFYIRSGVEGPPFKLDGNGEQSAIRLVLRRIDYRVIRSAQRASSRATEGFYANESVEVPAHKLP